MNPFVHLHVHSQYSPMSGASSLEEICRVVKAQGSDAVALTDTNGLYGAVRFVEVAGRNGLKPILGTELVSGPHRAVLLAKNQEGYANLSRLISARHGGSAFDLVIAVEQYRDGLIIISDDLPALVAWKESSREDLYVELTPGFGMHQALLFGRAGKIAPVATNRVHFVNPKEYEIHRLLRAIDLNTTLSRLPDNACVSPGQWLAPAGALKPCYSNVAEALLNTRRIADDCWSDWDFKNTIFPAVRSSSDTAAFETLKNKTYDGAAKRYVPVTSEIRARIEHELEIIREKRFAHYFLIVQDIVRDRAFICGRGSSAASIVAYCIGITDVEPVRNRLVFERFLNVARDDPPDIDVDFPWDERDAIIQSVFRRYGGDRVAMVANHNTLGLRAAFREMAKVYGMPAEGINRASAFIFKRLDLLQLAESSAARAWTNSLCNKRELDDPWPEILEMAYRVEGHFRNLGLHCGGIVLVPDEVRKYAPVEVSARGLPMVQWDKDQIEDAGLVKIDLLGNRSLAVIRDACSAIEKDGGQRLDYLTWDPFSDEKTKDLIRRVETLGCFNIESPATRLLLKKLWTRMPERRRQEVDVFDYLVMVSSLVRPAAISFVDSFIQRVHGKAYEPLLPALEATLGDSHGIMLYQEDVTRVAMSLAGFSLEEAEQLRKILNKKHKRLELKDFRERFYRNVRARGASPDTADRVWNMIMSFTGYSFCKPHSISYAQLSFKCAYLKAHSPAAFMAAVISNEGGFYPTFAYVSEAKRMGLEILAPDINFSDWAYTATGKMVRVGFMQIKGLERFWVDRVLAERKKSGPFKSFGDFWRRTQPKLAQARLLIKAGCFDFIAEGLTRPGLLWRAHGCSMNESAAVLPNPENYSEEKKLRDQIEILGFPLSCHPLDLYASALGRLESVSARNMGRHIGQYVEMVGWLVSEKMTQTRKGDPMEFVTFEDTTGLYEATFFPPAYRRFYQLIKANRPYVLWGKVEDDFGAITLNVNRIEYLDMRPASAILS